VEEIAAATRAAITLEAEELAAVRSVLKSKTNTACSAQPAAAGPVPSKKRKKRLSISRRSKKKSKENAFLGGKLTAIKAERIAEAGAMLDVLQPYVDALPWENVCDGDGRIITLGRKYQGLFVMARYVAAGWDKTVSAAVAEHIFDVSGSSLRRTWTVFDSSEQNFVACMSKRGHHPKLQDLLENVQTQIECRAWLDEHSDLKGDERSSPHAFANWLNAVQLPAMLLREEGSRLKIGLLVSQQCRHKVSIPLHGVSTSLTTPAAAEISAAPLAAAATAPSSSSSAQVLSAATVLKAIAHVERVTVSEKTAARYMHRLGYTRVAHRKGTFFDGHDREDVVKDRLLYLAEKLEQDKSTLHAMPTAAEVVAFVVSICVVLLWTSFIYISCVAGFFSLC